MNWSEFTFLVWSDLDRYHGNPGIKKFLWELFVGQGFRYSFWFRLNQYLLAKPFWMNPLRLFSRLILHHYSYKFHIDVSLFAMVGPGLKIEHHGTIFVNGRSRIGQRCTLCQGVTLGEYGGAPTLGDCVFVGPGAKVIGGIYIGNNAIIGANCVVTKEVPENAVVVGVPGKVISLRGNLRGPRLDEAKRLLESYRLRVETMR
ncbi:MAG: serine acetyltransferase [Phycisphaerales bacterium]|nr:serine acetyltransferase [Phycisphaerales bacterium]